MWKKESLRQASAVGVLSEKSVVGRGQWTADGHQDRDQHDTQHQRSHVVPRKAQGKRHGQEAGCVAADQGAGILFTT